MPVGQPRARRGSAAPLGRRAVPARLNHGLSEDEILHTYRNPLRVWGLGDGFMMIVGPNQAAIFLEVG